MRASIETPGEYRIAGEKEGKVERLSKKVAGPGRVVVHGAICT